MWTPEEPDFLKQTGSIFLLAAWQELFHGFTPDSYQPRLHNVASLIDEVVDMGRRCIAEPRYQPQVAKIQAELASALKSEEAFLSQIPDYLSRANLLAEAKTSQSIVAGGKILQDDRRKYWGVFKKSASAAIENLPKGKSEALENIRRLATFAFQQGKEDDDVWDPIIKDEKREPSQIFKDMISLTQEDEKDFVCTLSILGGGNGMHSIVRRQGYQVVSSNSLPDYYRDEISSPGGQTLHVQITVRERSIRNAVAFARRKLGIDMGYVSLYTNPASLRLHSKVLVSNQHQDRIFVQTEQAFRRLYPRSNARRDIKEALDHANKHTVDRRILAAVEQLALASASSDTRTRLVSLWASLETLAGAHEGDSALARVSDLLVPLVVSRHVHRTTRYLTILMQHFGKQTGNTEFGSGFTTNKQNIASQLDMLRTLTSGYCDPKIVDLLKFAEHPLLRFHIYRTWATYCTPKSLHDKLRASKQRLEWQIARIYRARNLLVHEGEEVPHIVPLLDNLQNYLSTLVQRIIHELKRHPDWSLRSLIEYWNGRMNHSLHCLVKCPNVLTTRDFLERGKAETLWPSPA